MSFQAITAKIKLATKGLMLILTIVLASTVIASAAPQKCGSGETAYTPSIELGCEGKGNPILDLLFAIVRFLSYGVGLVIVASLAFAGIQYSASQGDPGAHAKAIKRIQSNVSALLIFVFAYAILNYLIPGAVLK